MRRLFIIRKDLNLSPGKLAAMISHCTEAYWTNLLKNAEVKYHESCSKIHEDCDNIWFDVKIPHDIWYNYVNGIFTKTICEAKNLNDLNKVKNYIESINNDFSNDHVPYYLIEGRDYGFINDNCLTELTPENPDGTTTIGVWFRPMPDNVIQRISKKYKLYGAFDNAKSEITYYSVDGESYGGMYDQSYECYGKYRTYAEAKKHFDYFVKNKVKGNEVFCKYITHLSDDRCEYNDGCHQWSYTVAINKITVGNIKDKFVEPS